jgi:hypothetical protein
MTVATGTPMVPGARSPGRVLPWLLPMNPGAYLNSLALLVDRRCIAAVRFAE